MRPKPVFKYGYAVEALFLQADLQFAFSGAVIGLFPNIGRPRVGSAARCGFERDGWLTPEAKVQIKDPESGKRLILTLEVPGWLPFDYPVTLQITVDGYVKETFEFAQSGTHKIHLPLTEAGTIALRIDKWFVPANLGIGSPDQRPLAYRLKEAGLEEISSIVVKS
jgi:hypothetical protein